MRILLAFVLSFVLCACTSLPASDRSQVEEIQQATKAWQAAYDSRDAKRIVASYAPDAVLWGTTAKTIAATPGAVWDYFKDAASRPNARVVIGEQHVRAFGDVALNSGYYTFTDLRDGNVVPRPARFTFVFRKVAGSWLLVAHHSSAMP